jgi:hypothetical protein
MNCHDTRERLLERRATAGVRRHLEHCDDCRAYRREVETGGRELAEAFLAVGPSPGFEERVATALRGEETVGGLTPDRLVARILTPALFGLLLVAGYMLMRGDPPPAAPGTPPEAPETPVVVLTQPEFENPLCVTIHRDVPAAPTRLLLSFAGEQWSVDLTGDLERQIFLAWAQGARKAELAIGPEVPGREIALVLEILEKAGFSYRLHRPKY